MCARYHPKATEIRLDIDFIGRRVPLLVDLKPSGDHYMEDLHRVNHREQNIGGTARGSVMLHVVSESAIEGPLAVVQDGDEIRLSVTDRKVDLLVSDEEIARRLQEWSKQSSSSVVSDRENRGYRKFYKGHVLQADQGADFDFLRAV